ncbi:MAG: prepilin cleavage protein [Gracilibacter sp. BRH_c7a]|nr:MAG: prepilin cleavage protein [Gracilibacter sp. BRH_c7a]
MAKKSSGYSLLEILLVLTLLAGAGFLLLIQIPHNLELKEMEISSEIMLNDLREVQQAAIAENVWYRVKFYPHTKEYRIFRQGDFIRSVGLSEGVQYGNTPSELTLLPTGAPVTGMTIILTTSNLERKVIIAPVMGRIRLEIVR